ncbi:MGMT family protein [Candidatus Omnitrophota bacterium]
MPKELSGILRNDEFTGFQKAVYRAVCAIPRGEVRSYRWVAKRAGSPDAYRACGNALNRNPLPGVIPCHRVIRQDRTIGAFSKGVKAKRKLLRSEGIDWL